MASHVPPTPPVIHPGSGNSIIINPCQRRNPALNHIRNVGHEYGEIPADFQVGKTAGVLFLSLQYHRLHTEYIYTRIEKLGGAYNLRILLVLCDITDHRDSVRELTKTCIINNITVIVAFSYVSVSLSSSPWTETPISFEEVGHYLSIYKQFEFKPPDLIRERVEKDYDSLLKTTLTSINKINKTDVETLRTSFGVSLLHTRTCSPSSKTPFFQSFANIANASNEQLQNLPGFGPIKVKNLKSAFEKPLRNKATEVLSEHATLTMASNSRIEESQRESSPPWDIELDLNPLHESSSSPIPGNQLSADDVDL
ncbi:hypothetical protein M378DRAFT_103789 [Amanita muscaria Koide BX008]|uniref:ERCC1-like central domain-containing protein n=1 Tax=Amanita muscaria (strain Koide BX008) TaxID=946122 RepID=A0A0C2XAB3_AMAMK|nr:hypothetical protein M378DRAFT_103789 [Amanita muscaria Koide BX008]